MLGTVTRFSKQAASGTIRSEQGETFDFDLAAVLTYDMSILTEGKLVHFETAGCNPCRATNIALETPAAIHPSGDRYREIRQLRYVGFQHNGNFRTYRYERLTPGAPTQNFAVDADLALFHVCRVAIQDGPAMCMRILTVSLESGRIEATAPSFLLTEQDIRDYQAALPLPAAKNPKAPRRPSPVPPAYGWVR